MTTDKMLPVTGNHHVKISAEDLAKGLCSMTCPQCLAIPSTNGLCPLCSDSGWVVRAVEEAAKMRTFLRWEQIDKRTKADTGDEAEDSFHIGVSDGFQEAVQIIDTLTGGDGEYRFAMNGDPDRHCPTPVEMIERIVSRLAAEPSRGDGENDNESGDAPPQAPIDPHRGSYRTREALRIAAEGLNEIAALDPDSKSARIARARLSEMGRQIPTLALAPAPAEGLELAPGFEAEQDVDTFTIRFPSGHCLTARADGKLIVTNSKDRSFSPFSLNVSKLVDLREVELSQNGRREVREVTIFGRDRK